jgi:hypothetical protein
MRVHFGRRWRFTFANINPYHLVILVAFGSGVRGNRRMPNTTQILELFVVIQCGGSSGEKYLHSFPTQATAKAFIRRSLKASYDCFGPFPLVLPEAVHFSKQKNSPQVEWNLKSKAAR